MAVMAEPEVAPDDTAVTASSGQSWRSVLSIATAVLLGCFGVAALIVLGHWALSATPSPSPPAPATRPSASSAIPTTPTPIASSPDQDRAYLRTLKERGIAIANPAAAVYNAKMVCDNLTKGLTVPAVAAAFRASSPEFAEQAQTYVAVSVHAYCAQFSNLLPPGA